MNAVSRSSLLVVMIIVMLSNASCLLDLRPGAGVGSEMLDNSVYVFWDRSDAIYEHLFIMRNGEVFAQVAVFPGHEDKKWYFLKELPEAPAAAAGALSDVRWNGDRRSPYLYSQTEPLIVRKRSAQCVDINH